MKQFVRNLIGPVLIFAVALVGALAARQLLAVSAFEALIAGSAIFCVLMVLFNHIILNWSLRRAEKKLSAVLGLEENLLSRIRAVESETTNEKPLPELDGRLLALEQSEAKRQNELQKERESAAAFYSDENIVQMPTQNSQRKRETASRQQATLSKTLFDEGNFSVRLQPIVNLIDKQTVAVEAFGQLELEGDQMDGATLSQFLTLAQQAEFDHRMIGALSRVVRKMERDGQSMPIHYEFMDPSFSSAAEWKKIASQLKADPKLANNLVPVANMQTYLELKHSQTSRFLELREYGLKPCLGGGEANKAFFNLIEENQFSNVKISIAHLLVYTAKEGEQIADQVLPRLEKLGISLFVDGIEKAHHAANMIDLDLAIGQGSFISQPRKINLGGIDAAVGQ